MQLTRNWRNILIAVIALCIIGALAYAAWIYLKPAGSSIEMVGVSSIEQYSLSGTTLTRLSTTPIENRLGKNRGIGHALGTLPNGSLLALTPLGLSVVKADGTTFQIISASGTGSTTPIGAAANDLSTIAFENQTTGAIDVFSFDPIKLTYAYQGSAVIPAPAPTDLDSHEVAGVLEQMGLDVSTSTKPRTLTTDEAKRFTDAVSRLPSYRTATRVVAVAIANDSLYVQTNSGIFYAFPFSAGKLGTPHMLTLSSKP